MNKAILIGNLGKNAEVKKVNETYLLKFSVATSEKYKDKNGEWVEQTEWHNIDYWSKSDKIAQYLTKGMKVSVEGKIQTKEHEGKYYTSIRAQQVNLLGEMKKAEAKQEAKQPSNEGGGSDQLPF